MKTESKGREKHEEKYPGEMQPKKMVMQNSWMKAQWVSTTNTQPDEMIGHTDGAIKATEAEKKI